MRLVQIEEEKNNKKKSSLKAADCLLQRLVNGFNTVDYFDKYYRNNACDNKNLDGMSRSSLCQPLLPVFLISNFYSGNDPEKISEVEGGREGEGEGEGEREGEEKGKPGCKESIFFLSIKLLTIL